MPFPNLFEPGEAMFASSRFRSQRTERSGAADKRKPASSGEALDPIRHRAAVRMNTVVKMSDDQRQPAVDGDSRHQIEQDDRVRPSGHGHQSRALPNR